MGKKKNVVIPRDTFSSSGSIYLGIERRLDFLLRGRLIKVYTMKAFYKMTVLSSCPCFLFQD